VVKIVSKRYESVWVECMDCFYRFKVKRWIYDISIGKDIICPKCGSVGVVRIREM